MFTLQDMLLNKFLKISNLQLVLQFTSNNNFSICNLTLADMVDDNEYFGQASVFPLG